MKSVLNLSIDSEVLALIKAKEEITNVSQFIEHLFKVELDLKTEDKSNEVGELKIMNAKLSAELDKKKIEIRSLQKQIRETPKKKEEDNTRRPIIAQWP